MEVRFTCYERQYRRKIDLWIDVSDETELLVRKLGRNGCVLEAHRIEPHQLILLSIRNEIKNEVMTARVSGEEPDQLSSTATKIIKSAYNKIIHPDEYNGNV